MACWPATIVGAFFIVLILFDTYIHNYDDLPMHGVIGVLLTLVFWIICSTLGQSLSAAILVVPATFAIIFILGIWVTKKSLQNRGCCVSCGAVGGESCDCPADSEPVAPVAPIEKPKCPPPKPKSPPPKSKCPPLTDLQSLINLNAGVVS
jgi:hypothetical protein